MESTTARTQELMKRRLKTDGIKERPKKQKIDVPDSTKVEKTKPSKLVQVDTENKSSKPEPRPKDDVSKKAPSKDLSNALPRQVLPYGPATLPQRSNCMKHIKKVFIETKHPYPNWATVEQEYAVAKSSTKLTYHPNIRTLVKDIKQGKYRYKSGRHMSRETEKESSLYDNALVDLIIPEDVLKKWNYVLDPVTPKDLDPNMTTTCARCGEEFTISNKRNIRCVYHQLKPMFKYDAAEGRKTKNYTCCSQSSEESQGCCVSNHHVFKLEDSELLAGVVPFAPTPSRKTNDTLFAAGIDCEMGYTTFGLELIRVTVVDWKSRKVVLDRTVYPYGGIIDLNTRFSGVHSLKDGIKIGDKVEPTITFKEARDLIFNYISSSTVIIGHGLENDLNAMRLVHKRVVDTALRYPTFKPMYRISLKQLAFKYLSRTIQDGEHDSSEDAITAMDIVLSDIKKKMPK